jgi:hypothetical protein
MKQLCHIITILALVASALAATPNQLLIRQAEALKSNRIAPVLILELPKQALLEQCCLNEEGWCVCAAAPNPVCHWYPWLSCNALRPRSIESTDALLRIK